MKIILADDHEIFRDSLSTLIGTEEQFDIIAKVGNGKQLIEKVKQDFPDLCIVDMDMPEGFCVPPSTVPKAVEVSER